MEYLIDAASKVSWPGACVLIALIIGFAATVISLFGEWPVLIKKTIVNNKEEKK